MITAAGFRAKGSMGELWTGNLKLFWDFGRRVQARFPVEISCRDYLQDISVDLLAQTIVAFIHQFKEFSLLGKQE